MPLIYEKKDGIAYLTMNRPEARNALDPETVVEMAEAWKDFKEDDGCRVAILTGAGDAFCSGADLKKLIPLVTGAREPETDADMALKDNPLLSQIALLRTYDIYKPVIAAINGYCFAGGVELMLATDIRVASEKAVFAIAEVKWGIFPMSGSTVRLPRQIPFCKAMEILLTGERFDANELLEMGLINKVVPHGEVLPEAERYARILTEVGPFAVKKIKESIINCLGLPIEKAMEKELTYGMPVYMSEDAREGPRAFKEKRKPRFKGK